ncbi:uncharacterized protein I206_100502 [Kwoniella pini CBS 10737]|uniref:Uncharacterized protein n=1 Tax=Kwoniella pini CBS 10737 TaxID=1296096 RepID=A0A1B9IDM0_9TREE|nr:uncharacterized protein I206_00826 [Kwoniella pini CBS 10737]OCF53521.1 hypothetical protein I206_00826 [Kwoniella pini CBS 10737]
MSTQNTSENENASTDGAHSPSQNTSANEVRSNMTTVYIKPELRQWETPRGDLSFNIYHDSKYDSGNAQREVLDHSTDRICEAYNRFMTQAPRVQKQQDYLDYSWKWKNDEEKALSGAKYITSIISRLVNKNSESSINLVQIDSINPKGYSNKYFTARGVEYSQKPKYNYSQRSQPSA